MYINGLFNVNLQGKVICIADDIESLSWLVGFTQLPTGLGSTNLC